MEDLSKIHHPISNLFGWPKHADDWRRFELSDEQVAFFNEHGYLAGVRMLDAEQLEALRAQ